MRGVYLWRMHVMASWSLQVFLIRTRWSYPCSPWAERCPLAKWRAGPLGRQRRGHLFGSLLAVAVLSSVMLFVWDQPSCRCDRMGKGGGDEWWAPRHGQFCFADKLGQELEVCGEQNEEKEQGWRQGGGRTRAGDAAGAGSPEDTIYSTCWLWLIKGRGERVMACGLRQDRGQG